MNTGFKFSDHFDLIQFYIIMCGRRAIRTIIEAQQRYNKNTLRNKPHVQH